jgi:hypothetical protein
LLQKAAARNRAGQLQNSLKEAEQTRNRLNWEVEQLQRIEG